MRLALLWQHSGKPLTGTLDIKRGGGDLFRRVVVGFDDAAKHQLQGFCVLHVVVPLPGEGESAHLHPPPRRPPSDDRRIHLGICHLRRSWRAALTLERKVASLTADSGGASLRGRLKIRR